ncbi:right-handed parallel beta-helix repeat-containing protein [Candidatus Nomurabacteria bacterium]|nr:right-handed parallel beta-helix repeat-containing protein [Candidatus Nomurabacteria bacterium]
MSNPSLRRRDEFILGVLLVFIVVFGFYYFSNSSTPDGLFPSLQLAQISGQKVEVVGQETIPPTTQITSPGGGEVLSGLVTVTATASDNVSVNRVELWKDESLFRSTGSRPYNFIWDTTASSNSTHTLQTRAYDAAGNVGLSPTVTVSVSNTGTPPPAGDNPGGSSNSDPNNLANGSSVLFVDKNNSNCSDQHSRSQALNPQTPWCGLAGLTENHGLTVRPGDTVYFRAGDYTGREAGIISDGTPSGRITIKPYPGDMVIWRGGSTSYERLFSATTDYLTLEGFTIVGHIDTSEGSLYMPVLLSFSNNTGLELRNLTIEPFQSVNDIGFGNRWPSDHSREGWGHAVKLYNSDNFKIQNIKITCQASTDVYPALKFNGDGLQLDNVRNGVVENSEFKDCAHIPLTTRFNSYGVTIQNNVISNVFHTGMASGVGSHNNIIRNNIIKNYNSIPNDLSNRSHGIELLGENDSLIYNNIVYNGANNGNGISLGNSQDSNFSQNNNNKIFHNTVYSTNYNNISLGSNGLFGTNNWVNNNQIKNNITYGIQQYQSEGQFLHGEIRVYGYDYEGNNGYGNIFQNNLVKDFRPEEKPIVSRNFRNNTYNRYSVAEFNSLPWASGNIEGDPKFINPSAGDFHLQATSPAINAAPCLPEVTVDFDGRSRSAGGGCTIGAFELDLVNPPPPPPVLEEEPVVEVEPRTEDEEPELITPAACGDGVLDAGEQCDGNLMGGLSCRLLGFLGGGSLRCYSGSSPRACRLDVEKCLLAPNQPPPVRQVPETIPATKSSPVSGTTESPELSTCRERWLCRQGWSECVDGKQTRECVELTQYGTTSCRPRVERACNENDLASDVLDTKAIGEQEKGSSVVAKLNLTPVQTKALAVLVPTFFATLAILATVIIRTFML